MNKSLKILNLISCIVIILLFSACENDMKTVSRLSRVDTIPMLTISNIEVKQTEAGKLNLILTAPVMRTYGNNNPRTDFPKGLKIVSYDSAMRVVSELTANYGIKSDVTNKMEARNNVVVKNFVKQTTLTSEELIWDKNTRKTYSNKFVTIVFPDKRIFGEGMESDEIFDNWHIKRIRGEVFVSEDK